VIQKQIDLLTVARVTINVPWGLWRTIGGLDAYISNAFEPHRLNGLKFRVTDALAVRIGCIGVTQNIRHPTERQLHAGC
jgi:hypothetical protein